MIGLDPAAQCHFDAHQKILYASGIALELEYVSPMVVVLSVQQIAHPEAPITAEELEQRARAVFRFLPYTVVVKVKARPERPVFGPVELLGQSSRARTTLPR